MTTIRDLSDLTGRVALVVGGTGHIGRAASDTLAELGAAVAVADLDPATCTGSAADLHERHGVPTAAFPVDLQDERATRALPAAVVERLGRLDIVVHAAALVGTSDLEGWVVPFAEQRLDAWRLALEVNLTSTFVVAQAAADALRRSGHGSVVLLGSIYGVGGPDPSLYEGTGLGTPAAYAASKGGLLQLVRWLATELAPDVRVNALSPGGVARGQTETFVARYEQRTPLRRMATEDDLRGAIAYLCTDLSSYVTGQNLLVDGGWTAW